MRKFVDLHPILDLITEKLTQDREALRRILEGRDPNDLRNFDEQDRLLWEIQAGVRSLDILEGVVESHNAGTGVRNVALPSARLAVASE
ncbi:MAG TPA: hypothetical protein VIL72_00570 [Beijerinckiaceae bacterium]|jgi:hypothetical protein